MFYGIWLVVLGMLGAANLIIAKKPDAREIIAKFAPYQGWIGAASALGGTWILISALLNLSMLGSSPIWWITLLANGVLQFALGLLLGVGVLKSFIKNPEANTRMDQMITKLAPYQGTLGLVAMGVGVWAVISNVLF